MEQAEHDPILVFYAYAREDEYLRDELGRHLKMLERRGLIKNWHDRKIGPGTEWSDQIDTHLNTAQIILPLISADFIDSDYCFEIEMKRAMELHEAGQARVIPVILRPCDWKDAPFAKLQALPRDAAPVTTWGNQDEAFLSVVDGIRMVLDEFNPRRTQPAIATPRIEGSNAAEQATAAIMGQDQTLGARDFTKWCIAELDRVAPDFTRQAERDDLIVEAIDNTKHVAAGFASVAEIISARNAREAARILYKAFGQIVSRYNPALSPGRHFVTDWDHYKFAGHELFVILFASLMRDERWAIVAELLSEGIAVSNPRDQITDVEPYTSVSASLESLVDRNRRLKLSRLSVRADLLRDRHSEGELGDLVTMQQFMEADFFLFLRSVLHPTPSGFSGWRPWSTIYMHEAQFLREACYEQYARNLLAPLGIGDIQTLRRGVLDARSELMRVFSQAAFYNPLTGLDPTAIGTL